MKTHWHGGSETEFRMWLNLCLINNYRKLHGKPMKRWAQLRKLECKRKGE